MYQIGKWNVLVVLVILGQALGQSVERYGVVRTDSASPSPGQPTKQGTVRCTGKVVDLNDRPIADAKVTLYLLTSSGADVMLHFSNWGTTFGGQMKVGLDGRFSVAALPQGHRYDVTVRADGFGEVRKTVSQDEAVAGPKDMGDFHLALASLSITGIVLDEDNKPVVDARVDAQGEGQSSRVGIRTDGQGRFTIEGVCRGPVWISTFTTSNERMYGSVQTEGGAKDVKIFMSTNSGGSRLRPRVPRP